MLFFFVQNKSVFDVAKELNRIHDLGLRGTLSPADITGGTFSLSNIGAVSSLSLCLGCVILCTAKSKTLLL